MVISPLLIPIIALSIPLVAVLGRVIVQPIVKAVTHLAQIQATGVGQDAAQIERRTAMLEERLEGIEKVLGRLADDYEFRKELEAPRPRALDAATSSVASPASPTAQ